MQTGKPELVIQNQMNAIMIHNRGGIEELRYEKAAIPSLEAGDVLVKVMASGITKTELDWDETYRNSDGSDRLPSIPGHELAGIVVKVRDASADFSPGDIVYGLTPFNRNGTLAEYVAVQADFLSPLPDKIDFTKWAAVPLSGLTAWQALFKHGQLKAGQKVLIHGGAGGVGTYAVQLAKWAGATVIATASRGNVDFLEQLGVERAIDYMSCFFDDAVKDIDLVLDTVGGDTRDRSWRVLRKGGALITITAPLEIGEPKNAGVRGLFFIVEPSRTDLASLTALIEKGLITPFVQEVFPLREAKSAYELSNRGHSRGKTIVRIVE